MEFCDKCDSLVIQKKEKEKLVFICSSCGQVKNKGRAKFIEKTKGLKKIKAADDSSKEVLPKTEAECPSCNNNEAYFHSEQTRAADEPETLFFTCTKCSKRWREYE